VESGYSLIVARWQVFFPSRVLSGLTGSSSMVTTIVRIIFLFGVKSPSLEEFDLEQNS